MIEWSRVRIPISFATFCQCLLEETLKAVGPFYLVSMPGEVKHPTQAVNVQPVEDSIFYLVNNVKTTLIKNNVKAKVNIKCRIYARNLPNVYAPLSVILLSMLYAVEVNVGAWVAF